jgi:hypothetical protein
MKNILESVVRTDAVVCNSYDQTFEQNDNTVLTYSVTFKYHLKVATRRFISNNNCMDNEGHKQLANIVYGDIINQLKDLQNKTYEDLDPSTLRYLIDEIISSVSP